MSLLDWQSLIFLIPIGAGTMLAIGAAFALDGEGGAGHPEGDGVHHAVADAGRVPLSIRLMLGSLTFGGVGLSLSYLLGVTPLRTLVAAAVGLAGAVVVSGRVARLLSRRLPLLETETIARGQLLGSTGRAVLPLGAGAGLVQIHDRRGNLHQLPCRTLPGEPPLPAGTAVVLVEHDADGGFYYVSAVPAAIA